MCSMEKQQYSVLNGYISLNCDLLLVEVQCILDAYNFWIIGLGLIF